jgi:hypothetical protein
MAVAQDPSNVQAAVLHKPQRTEFSASESRIRFIKKIEKKEKEARKKGQLCSGWRAHDIFS